SSGRSSLTSSRGWTRPTVATPSSSTRSSRTAPTSCPRPRFKPWRSDGGATLPCGARPRSAHDSPPPTPHERYASGRQRDAQEPDQGHAIGRSRSEPIVGRVFASQSAASDAQAALIRLARSKSAEDLAWHTVELDPGPTSTARWTIEVCSPLLINGYYVPV